MILNSNSNVSFGQKRFSPRNDISGKTRFKSFKQAEARQIKNFIDDLQLIPENKRLYYSEAMMRAQFRPKDWKRFISKILKIV